MRKKSIHHHPTCWLKSIIIFSTSVVVAGLRPSTLPQTRSRSSLNLIVDSHAAHEAIQAASDLYSVLHDQSQHNHESLQAVLSTMYTATLDGSQVLKEAHGHSQPLFGPADPYLSSGHSIAPKVQNLIDMELDVTKNHHFMDKGDIPAAQLKELPAEAQKAISRGFNFMDGSQWTTFGEDPTQHLPGFVQPDGILPRHSTNPALQDTQEGYVAQVEWAANFLKVVDKLPYAAFVYALFEFSVLRRGIDLYKEEILDEEENTLILAETVAVTAVRLAVFAAIGFVTLLIFG